MSNNLTSKELARYSRHLNLPEFQQEHQQKLKNASVLIVGVGGLGSPVSLYLAAAGVGTIGIVDFDMVEESNLQRQILFGTQDLGVPKTEVAAKKLKDLNPNIDVRVHSVKLEAANALEIIQLYDIVADGTDNFATRYLVNDACVILGKPNVYASIFRFEGQASVFNYTDKQGNTGPNYRDLFPSPPPPGLVPSCAEGGVLGVLPGILGSIQASEVIKLITGIGVPLSGRLMLIDTFEYEVRFLNIKSRSDNPLTGDRPTQTRLIDYEEFCGMKFKFNEVPTLTVSDLKQMIEDHSAFKLIDVREPHEKNIADIGGSLIPQGSVDQNIDQIPKDQKTIFYCRTGKRSKAVVKKLIKKYGYNQAFNLEGGIMAWREEFDPSMTKY